MDAWKKRFESLQTAWWPAIETLMGEVLQAAIPGDSVLSRMADYHLRTGGKRIRAVLPLVIAEALGNDPGRLVPFGAACEMLHNASLVHDDVQDEDSVRRGQPSVWAKFGLPQAINLGDAMIACTFLLMQRLEVPIELRERATQRMLREMLRVIEGQVRDIELKDRSDVTLADYVTMVEGKTSRLLALPMGGAALLCASTTSVEQGLVEAARQIGVLFQIQDDVLDYYGDKGRGRSGNDTREGKRSILVVHCLASAGAQRAEWLRGVLAKPRDRTTAEDVAEARDLFERCGSLTYALEETARRRTATLAVPILANYPALREVLAEMCEIILSPLRPVIDRFAG